jgi:rhamnopyranosyl-N-acetylglucosaminyl-diphospho-decaprenol beta-1,3/1,4-galactofuranosyltransferase
MNQLIRDYKIAAVVVTCNRLKLLTECIYSLRNQTIKLDKIIIVNNSSTDGTLEWLSSQNDLIVINQENLGSAGGQYSGIKFGFEKGYDWIWCMDDDCYSELNALEELMKFVKKKNAKFANSFVLDYNNNPSFGLPVVENNRIVYTIHELTSATRYISLGSYDSLANLFNGTLLNSLIIEKIGVPDSTFFIWGDEIDYRMRIRSEGIPTETVFTSIVRHPQKLYLQPIFFPEQLLWKTYYLYRNKLKILKNEDRRLFGLFIHCRYMWGVYKAIVAILFNQCSNKRLRIRLIFDAIFYAYKNEKGRSEKYSPGRK